MTFPIPQPTDTLVPPLVQTSRYVFITSSRARYSYLSRDKRRHREEGDKRGSGKRKKRIQTETDRDFEREDVKQSKKRRNFEDKKTTKLGVKWRKKGEGRRKN